MTKFSFGSWETLLLCPVPLLRLVFDLCPHPSDSTVAVDDVKVKKINLFCSEWKWLQIIFAWSRRCCRNWRRRDNQQRLQCFSSVLKVLYRCTAGTILHMKFPMPPAISLTNPRTGICPPRLLIGVILGQCLGFGIEKTSSASPGGQMANHDMGLNSRPPRTR